MLNYFIAKLSGVNRRIAMHEGDANRRVASEAVKILLLPTSEVPLKYKEEYLQLRRLIELTIAGLPAPGLTPTKICQIQNKTASKYIKLLLSIEDSLSDL